MNELNTAINLLLTATLLAPIGEIIILFYLMKIGEHIDGSYTHTIRHVVILIMMLYVQFDMVDISGLYYDFLVNDMEIKYVGFAIVNLIATHHLSEERRIISW
jgi:hypothetical protein